MYAKADYAKMVALHGGTGTRNDRAKQHYQTLGFNGTLYDMEMAWLASRGRTGTYVDRWNQEFAAGGYSTGTLWDRLKNWTWPVVAVLGAYWHGNYFAPAYFADQYWAA